MKGIALIPPTMFVVLSMNTVGDVVAICICEYEVVAKHIVEKRREKHKAYCWYQKVEVIQ